MRSGAWVEWLLLAIAAGLFALARFGAPPAPAGFELRPRESEVLRLATWNVGGARGGAGHGLRDDQVAHVAGVLETLDPDVCFLQEVRSREQLERLRATLGPGWQALPGSGYDRRVVALARRGRLRAGVRSSPARLEVRYRAASGLTVVGVGLHADAWSSERRNGEIGVAVDGLLALRDRHGADLAVLAGDLNLDLDLDKRQDLFSDDAYRDVESYNYVAGRLSDAARAGGPTAEPDRRLDYLFVAPRETEVRRAGPWRGQRAADMDHDPVVADVVVPDRDAP